MKKRNIGNSFIKEGITKKIILKIIYVIVYMSVLYNILFLINTTITNRQYFKIFGISLFTMQSDSMKSELNKNDLIITKSYGKNEPQINDNISYNINDDIRINKIFNIQNDNGEKSYITKSNNNYYPDIEKIHDKQIIGKVICNISFIGFFINMLQSKWMVVFSIIFLLLKISYNKYIYKKKKERRRKRFKNIEKTKDFE